MKQLKNGIYKASNVTFDSNKVNAFSYDWWCFVKRDARGRVVFNTFKYSPTTSRHQSKVRNLMNSLGIKVDIEVCQRESL